MALTERTDVSVVLLGRPGSGKGTQAQRLAEAGWSHVNAGGLVRAEVTAGTAWGRSAAAAVARGDLLPSADLAALISREVRRLPFPVVIEGYPRRLSEAATLPAVCGEETLLIPVLLQVSRPEALARVRARLVCRACGWVTSRSSCPGPGGGCRKCSAPLISRADDVSEDVAARRMNLFETETFPLIDHLAGLGSLIIADSSQDPDTVYAEITGQIRQRSGAVTSKRPARACDDS